MPGKAGMKEKRNGHTWSEGAKATRQETDSMPSDRLPYKLRAYICKNILLKNYKNRKLLLSK